MSHDTQQRKQNACEQSKAATDNIFQQGTGMKLFLVGAICFCLVFNVIPVQANNAGDDGYFLSLKQKGQLIATGKIKDDQGHQYDIMIVPGYQPPLRTGWKGLKKAKHNIGQLFHKRKYRSLKTRVKTILSWSYKECLWKFTLKGAGSSWKNNFKKASNTTKTRAFGWWLAYPWAVTLSAVDNAGRIPAGLIGTAGGTTTGLALTPAFSMIESPVKAGWNGGVVGLAVPAVGVAWNTAIAPPMAFLGQKPTPARVDGFWVKQLDHRELSDEDAKLWVQLGRELLKSTESLQKERESAEMQYTVKIKSLQEEISSMQKELAERRKAFDPQEEKIVRAFPLTGSYESLVQPHRREKLPSKLIRDNMNKIKNALENDPDLDQTARYRIMRLLNKYFPEAMPYVAPFPMRR